MNGLSVLFMPSAKAPALKPFLSLLLWCSILTLLFSSILQNQPLFQMSRQWNHQEPELLTYLLASQRKRLHQ